MKIIIECKSCGNRMEIESETYGKVAYINHALRESNFDIFNVDIDIELQDDVVDDPINVNAKLKEIRIDCQNCGDYICLNF